MKQMTRVIHIVHDQILFHRNNVFCLISSSFYKFKSLYKLVISILFFPKTHSRHNVLIRSFEAFVEADLISVSLQPVT